MKKIIYLPMRVRSSTYIGYIIICYHEQIKNDVFDLEVTNLAIKRIAKALVTMPRGLV